MHTLTTTSNDSAPHTVTVFQQDVHIESLPSLLPQNQRHIEASDHIVLGKAPTNLVPEDTICRGNALLEARPGYMVVFASGAPHKQDGKGPRPIYLGLLMEIRYETKEGLIRWYITKTSAASWMGSAWVEDQHWKYGTKKDSSPSFNNKVGEWMPLSDVIYWGLELNDSDSNRGKIRQHDVQAIIYELQHVTGSQPAGDCICACPIPTPITACVKVVHVRKFKQNMYLRLPQICDVASTSAILYSLTFIFPCCKFNKKTINFQFSLLNKFVGLSIFNEQVHPRLG